MSTARLFTITTVLTIGAFVAWVVKGVVIALAGGLGQSPLEGPLFIIGLLLYVLGVAAIGLAVTVGRSTGVRVLGVVAAVAIGVLVTLGLDAIVASIEPADPHWVWEEAQLWIVSGATALGWLAWRNRTAQVPA
ncbi:hypothetical protein [Aeromicrobium sp.]|uniref:hypothetical protein n=1 Tax=Aeromicrobium sp. TaxID=1871063 RepID=UPI003D6A086F